MEELAKRARELKIDSYCTNRDCQLKTWCRMSKLPNREEIRSISVSLISLGCVISSPAFLEESIAEELRAAGAADCWAQSRIDALNFLFSQFSPTSSFSAAHLLAPFRRSRCPVAKLEVRIGCHNQSAWIFGTTHVNFEEFVGVYWKWPNYEASPI